MNNNYITYPTLPLRNTVIFPGLTFPLVVARKLSLASLSAAQTRGSQEARLVCITQKDADDDEPTAAGLYTTGTLTALRGYEQSSKGNVQILTEGLRRVRIHLLESKETCLNSKVEIFQRLQSDGFENNATLQEIYNCGQQLAEINSQKFYNNKTLKEIVMVIPDIVTKLYRIVSILPISIEKQQKILEVDEYHKLLALIHESIIHELKNAEIRLEITSKAKVDIEQQQRESMLRHQKKIIEHALGGGESELSETDELRQRLNETELPEIAEKEALREIKRMEKMSVNAADFQIARTYVELILELPWYRETKDQLDIIIAQKVLEENHYGLEEVKERIIEHLAILQMNPNAKASMLCLLGPPGVGKTSLGKSIAKSLKRKFEMLSLGGLHDESELRGHRRTYVGAMPGRIIQAIRRADAKNPLIMLDEIDKLGRDFRGDPGSALMEILDPTQNTEFRDNYLNLPFDLSKTMFIATANSLDGIPRPLLDRMEVLHLSGYSDSEKHEIAKRYLIPNQQKEAGLNKKQLNIQKDALMDIIQNFTREAGVRELERTIARVARKLARRILEGEKPVRVTAGKLKKLLGPQRFFRDKSRTNVEPGVVPGLAWTQVGGEVLYIEIIHVSKEKDLTLTGQLGDVMRESAIIARSNIRSIAHKYGINLELIDKQGIHIHIPAGAIQKDGPSAGITMAIALMSLYSGTPIKDGLAMTGEITLTGLVLPVGGVKEKVLAAHRSGINTVLLPKENEHDLSLLQNHVQKDMTFICVQNIFEVIDFALPELKLMKHEKTNKVKRPKRKKESVAPKLALNHDENHGRLANEEPDSIDIDLDPDLYESEDSKNSSKT